MKPPRKAGGKPGRLRIIGGVWRGRAIAVSAGDAIRPTSDRTREAVFNRLIHGFGAHGFRLHGARVVDAFAGTGALGLEALSRGAAHAVFLDRDTTAVALIKNNVAVLGAEDRALVMGADAVTPPRAVQSCDLALLDPPYGEDVAAAALTGLARQGWLRDGALSVVETAANAPEISVADFTVLDRRAYGRTATTFLLFKELGSE